MHLLRFTIYIPVTPTDQRSVATLVEKHSVVRRGCLRNPTGYRSRDWLVEHRLIDDAPAMVAAESQDRCS